VGVCGIDRWWEAPELTGVIVRGALPQTGVQLRLSVPPNQSPLCEYDDRSGVTDGRGEFALAGIRSMSWTLRTYRRHVSWTLCARVGAEGISGTWRMIYAYSGSPLHRLRLRCDLNMTDGDAWVEENKEF
jgi:hypothetical protein